MKNIIYLFLVCLVHVGCSEESIKKQVDVPDVSGNANAVNNESVYVIPSPNEQFDLLQQLGGEVNTLIIHDLSRLDEYSSVQSIALNFGVYSADAAYMMRFNQGKSVFMNYLSGLDKMGEKLGISQVYGKDLVDSIAAAQNDASLLFEISADNYLKVYDKMVDNEKDAELAMILTGGWIEIMHILFKTSGDFNVNPAIQESIAEQRYVLENLIDFTSGCENKEAVQDVIVMLESVLTAYKSLDCESSSVEVTKGGDNSIILDGGESCSFTRETYNTLRSLIHELRNKIIA